MVNYGSSVYDYIGGDVAAYIGSGFIGVFLSHCSGVEDGVTALQHVRSILM